MIGAAPDITDMPLLPARFHGGTNLSRYRHRSQGNFHPCCDAAVPFPDSSSNPFQPQCHRQPQSLLRNRAGGEAIAPTRGRCRASEGSRSLASPFSPTRARGGTAAYVVIGEHIGFFLLHCFARAAFRPAYLDKRKFSGKPAHSNLRRYSYLTRVCSLDLTQVCQPISSLLDCFRTALAVKSSLRSRPGARS